MSNTNNTAVAPWVVKAHEVISKLCLQAYVEANTRPNGMKYKKYRPYTVPEEAQELTKCIAEDDELRAKQIFLYDYKVSNLK